MAHLQQYNLGKSTQTNVVDVNIEGGNFHTALDHAVYDRIDAVATINFSTQFVAVTFREWRLFESGIYFVWRGYWLQKISEKVNTKAQGGY